MKKYKVKEKVHIFPMEVAWFYLPIPIEAVPDVPKAGWGSVPIMATVGRTTWRTSIFPMKKGYYFIPLKKAVREAEYIYEGDEITIKYQVASK